MNAALIPLILMTVLAAAAVAGELRDPMRPPAAAAEVPPAEGEAPASGVQAVFMRQGAKPAALINGKYVEQGGWVGDKLLLSVTESAVVLRDKEGRSETLPVIAGVEKKPAAQKDPRPAAATVDAGGAPAERAGGK